MKYFLYLFILCFFSCSDSNNRMLVKNIGIAQGSFYHIQYLSEDGESYQTQIDSILLEIDSSLSIYKQYSIISRLNNQEYINTDEMFNEVYAAAKNIYIQTEGSFDCSVYPLVKEWGFYKDFSGDSVVVDSLIFRNILPNIGFNKIHLINDSLVLPLGMSIDFNSIAQGYSVDLISKFIESKGDTNYLVEIGGEVRARGRNANKEIWRIGVDKPTDNLDQSNRFQFILELNNKSLATSGNYRKFYKKNGVRYSHTINPFSGFPAQNRLLSVSVIHDECMLADAYATAFMVMGVKRTKKFVDQHPEIEVYLVYTRKNGDWTTYKSSRLIDRILN